MWWTRNFHRDESRSSSNSTSAQHLHIWEVGDCTVNINVRQTQELHEAYLLPWNTLIPNLREMRGKLLQHHTVC